MIQTTHLPESPGIYLFKDQKEHILYIGKAKNLKKRVTQYFSPGSVWKQDMLNHASKIDFITVNNESEALYLEDNLIKKHQPYYNNLLKADNSYVYLKITKEDYPQIILTRKRMNDGSIYIGPKHQTRELKKLLQYLRRLLGYRGCKNTQFRQGKVCSDYHFGLCKGWCDNKIIEKEKGVNEYKQIIAMIISFFKGNTKPIERELKEQIQYAIDTENFERAAKLRDIYLKIDAFTEKQTVVLGPKITGHIFKIQKVNNRYLFVLLNFYEGKLIDIVRSKHHADDEDISSIIASFESEFGEFKYHKSHCEETQVYDKAILGLNNSLKLKKTEIKDIEKLCTEFIESYITQSSFQEENLYNDMLLTLQKRYNLKYFPYHIECIDISHLSGGWISGGLSCFHGGISFKKGYRKYKIKHKQTDDYEAIKELITRRFKNVPLMKGDEGDPKENIQLPNLLVIDGGKGQLGIIKKLLKHEDRFQNIYNQIDIIALGKGEARKTTNIGSKSKKHSPSSRGAGGDKITETIYSFTPAMTIKAISLVYDQADKILIKIRDEAHRFANYYRKQQMSKEWKS